MERSFSFETKYYEIGKDYYDLNDKERTEFWVRICKPDNLIKDLIKISKKILIERSDDIIYLTYNETELSSLQTKKLNDKIYWYKRDCIKYTFLPRLIIKK